MRMKRWKKWGNVILFSLLLDGNENIVESEKRILDGIFVPFPSVGPLTKIVFH